MKTVIYEWDVETVTSVESDEHEENEVLEHYHCESYREAVEKAATLPPAGCHYDIVLVRDDFDRRAWAYIDENRLPTGFEDASGHVYKLVPQIYHSEVAQYNYRKGR